jgi:hypothetical protein
MLGTLAVKTDTARMSFRCFMESFRNSVFAVFGRTASEDRRQR